VRLARRAAHLPVTAAHLPAGGGAQIFLAGLDVTGHGAGADSAFSAYRSLGFAMTGTAVLIVVLIARPGALPLALDRLLSLGTAGFGYASVRRWRSRIDGS
jgi:hypothetical protein